MSAFALVLALVAAVLHAAWNLVVKASEDQLVAGWTVVAGAALLNLPVLAVAGLPDRRVWGLILASSVVQVGYVLALAAAYRAGDLSFVYPLARGASPLLVAIIGVALLGDQITPAGWVGILTVTASLVVLAATRADRWGLVLALATAATISAYTSIDAAAVRLQGSALSVIGAEFIVLAVLLTTVVLALRGPSRMLGMVRADWRRALFGSFGTGAAYLLVMAAALVAPVGLVSGVRETSVLIAVVGGRFLLGESVTRAHLWTVAAAASGIVLIALS